MPLYLSNIVNTGQSVDEFRPIPCLFVYLFMVYSTTELMAQIIQRSTVRWLVKDDFEGMWKEAAVVDFIYISNQN